MKVTADNWQAALRIIVDHRAARGTLTRDLHEVLVLVPFAGDAIRSLPHSREALQRLLDETQAERERAA